MQIPKDHPTDIDDGASDVVTRLQQSELFRDYQRAFESTTGLPLVLRKAGSFDPPMRTSRRLNPFCAMMASTNKTCAACLQLQERVEQLALSGLATLECHAGLVESAVPVRMGSHVLGFLQTGQVFLRQPSRKKVDAVLRDLAEPSSGLDAAKVESVYSKTRVISKAQYASIIRLLSIFAEHLAAISNQLMIRESAFEPPAIRRVRMFIAEHQSEEISLQVAARSANMSPFYFCKAFKKSTGLTFTGYLARTRIESVKSLLLNVHVHVSEAAYTAGFQSLSQFNRVFRRVSGESPSEYRLRIHGRGAPAGRGNVQAA